MKSHTYYDILGVSRDATLDEITTAKNALAKVYHPDANAHKNIEKINKKILAPVRKGDVVGSIVYTLDGNEIGRSDIIAKRGVQKAGFSDYLIKVSAKFLIGEKN